MLRAVCTQAQVQRLKESRLKFRGDGDQDPVASEDKARHIVPTDLLVRVQRLKNYLYKDVEGPNTRPIVLSMITGSYFRRRTRSTILEPDETKFASHLNLFGIFRFRFVITLAFLLFGCEQVSFAMSGDSEVFAIEADSHSDLTILSSFVEFGGCFCAGIFLALPFPSGPGFPNHGNVVT